VIRRTIVALGFLLAVPFFVGAAPVHAQDTHDAHSIWGIPIDHSKCVELC
jgi:hypothetical protein